MLSEDVLRRLEFALASDPAAAEFVAATNASTVAVADMLRRDGEIVKVASLADLPDAVGGVITLESGKTYDFRADIDFGTSRMVCDGAFLLSSVSAVLTTASASALITYTAGEVGVLQLRVLNPIGPAFDITSGPGNTVFLSEVIVTAQQSVVRDPGIFLLVQCLFVGIGGLELSGTIGECQVINGSFQQLAGTNTGFRIPAGSTVQLFDMRGVHINVAAGQCGVDIGSGIVPALAVGQISGNLLTGAGDHFAAGGVNPSTIGWRFVNNGEAVLDSAYSGGLAFAGNALVTTITVLNQWEAVNVAAWTLDAESERFVLVAPDILKYVGKSKLRMQLSLAVTLEASSGTNKTYDVVVQSDTGGGYVELANTTATLDYRASPVSVSKPALHVVEPDELLRVRIRATNSTQDVIVNSCTVLVGKTG